jgi:hypothetical protein
MQRKGTLFQDDLKYLEHAKREVRAEVD